jgi:uncharacterized cupin superfamily protein
MTLANWDDLEPALIEVEHISATWQNLGGAAHSQTVGVRRVQVTPGRFSTPVHSHGRDEEIIFVLAGDGLLWQDGATFELGSGDCVVFRPMRELHTFRAGDAGLDLLVFGERRDVALTRLPRAGIAWSWPAWVELGGPDHPFAREAAAGPPDCPPPSSDRPRNIVALEDAPAHFGGLSRRLGLAAGARATGLNHVSLPPGGAGAPAHCHSHEEELFVVLDSEGTLSLHPRGGGQAEAHPVRRGSVVSRPAGTGVAHAFEAGERGMTYLAYGTREPADMCFYPESGRVSLRGLGIALRSPEIDFLP